jgi:peptide/nickel transport system substrate-binding protein
VETFRYRNLAAVVLCVGSAWAAEDLLTLPGVSGRPGGRLVSGERNEPKTLNPIFATDVYSKNIIHKMMADLIRINRSTLKTEPSVAKSYTVSRDGLHYVLELRQGLKFSDGHPFDADDVVFTFQVYLDPVVKAPQRSLWIFGGKPVVVRKLGPHRVAFDMPQANAVGERIFDSVPMLPRHLLEKSYKDGKLKEAWNLRTPPGEIAGLGPFRLKEYLPGQRMVLERNPHYWKKDAAGNRLPYLAELTFAFAGAEDMQVMRFQAGESDTISRIAPKDSAVLQRDAARRGYTVHDGGPGFEYSFLFFNLNDSASPQAPWRKLGFRKAVAAAIDHAALVRLVYQGFAAPLASPVAAGNKLWVNGQLPRPVRSLEQAREFLKADGFKWGRDGSLEDAGGRKVNFSIIVGTTNPERVQAATLIQADLKSLGIRVDVVKLEQTSLVDRVLIKREYDAAIMALASGDADPNVDMPIWLSSGSQHMWNPEQKTAATAWEAEIDGLMRKQLVTRRYEERKRLFDRVQELAMQNMPLIPLVSPHVLVGAKKNLGNFRPGLLEPYTLWNVEELYWQSSGSASGR